VKKRNRLFMVGICLAVFFQAGSLGATMYRYQDLTPQGLPPMVSISVNGINDAKQMVGYYSQYNSPDWVYQAFFWDPVKGYTLLKSLANGTNSKAYGINKQGQIVGQAVNIMGYSHGCLWSNPSQSPTDLNGTDGDPNSSCAYAINDNGLMVGVYGGYLSTPEHAYKWTGPMPTGGTDLGTLGGSTSLANSVNNAGQIVGIARNGQGYTRACLWEPGQAGEDLLPSLPTNAQADQCFINAQGNVTGDVYPGPIAFYWDYQTKTVVSNIAPQLNQSWAEGLSNSNQAIGKGYNGGQPATPPFVFWNPVNGTQDLNQMVVDLPQGITIASLSAISPQGYIVGLDSQGHACLLTQVVASSGIDLLLLLD